MSKWTPWTSGPWTHATKVPVDISRSPEFLLGCAHETGIGDYGISNALLIAAAPEMAELLERINIADRDAITAGWAIAHLRVLAEEARALLSKVNG